MIKCPISGKPCVKYKAFHITDIKDQKINTLNVCEDCIANVEFANIINDDDKIIEKNDSKLNEPRPDDSKLLKTCSFCGLTLDELLKKSRFGCAKCYDVFDKFLTVAIEKLQQLPPGKELTHVGRVPTQWKKNQIRQIDPKKFLLELKQKLALAVKNENFNKAKEIKEYIFAFESFMNKLEEYKNDQEQQSLILDQIYEFIYNAKELEK